MSFRLVPKSVTLNDLERRYFNEFGKPAFQHITASARKKERSCSLSHLLMSFLFDFANITAETHALLWRTRAEIVVTGSLICRLY